MTLSNEQISEYLHIGKLEQLRVPSTPLPLGRLTRTETAVFLALVEGLEVKDIAVVRGRAPETVRNHLKAIYRKLEVQGIREILIRYWRDSQPEQPTLPVYTGEPLFQEPVL